MRIKFQNGSTSEAHPVRFAIFDDKDNPELTFDGYIRPNHRWNGWLQPYVTREVYEQILEKLIGPVMFCDESDEFMLEQRDEMIAWFDGDGWVNGVPSGDDQPDTACGLYNVGWGWVWDKAYEQDQEPTDYQLHRQAMDAKA